MATISVWVNEWTVCQGPLRFDPPLFTVSTGDADVEDKIARLCAMFPGTSVARIRGLIDAPVRTNMVEVSIDQLADLEDYHEKYLALQAEAQHLMQRNQQLCKVVQALRNGKPWETAKQLLVEKEK